MGDQDVTSWTEADIFAASAEAEHLAARKRRHGRGLGSVSDGAGTGSETKKPSQQKGVDKSSEVCREGSSTVKPLAEETGTMMASQAENLFHRRAAARMVARGTPASGSVPVRIRASPVVRLQVYDIWDFATRAGLPIYHLGVEVFGSEVYFSARGVQSCKPAGHRIHPHRRDCGTGRDEFQHSRNPFHREVAQASLAHGGLQYLRSQLPEFCCGLHGAARCAANTLEVLLFFQTRWNVSQHGKASVVDWCL